MTVAPTRKDLVVNEKVYPEQVSTFGGLIFDAADTLNRSYFVHYELKMSMSDLQKLSVMAANYLGYWAVEFKAPTVPDSAVVRRKFTFISKEVFNARACGIEIKSSRLGKKKRALLMRFHNKTAEQIRAEDEE